MRQLWMAAGMALVVAPQVVWAQTDAPAVRVEAAAPAVCTLAFQSSWNRLDFAVGVDRVRGSGVTLTRHGDVISGFLYGSATRMHRKGNKLSGVLGGVETTIYVERDGDTLTLRGALPGMGRATIVSAEGKVEVFSDGVALELARESAGVMRGEVKARDRFSEASLRLSGCSRSLLSSRPEVVLAVAMAPLVR